MSIEEIESAVSRLPPADLAKFAQWFEDFLTEQWDRQIERDSAAGRLKNLTKQADADFEAGRCTPF